MTIIGTANNREPDRCAGSTWVVVSLLCGLASMGCGRRPSANPARSAVAAPAATLAGDPALGRPSPPQAEADKRSSRPPSAPGLLTHPEGQPASAGAISAAQAPAPLGSTGAVPKAPLASPTSSPSAAPLIHMLGAVIGSAVNVRPAADTDQAPVGRVHCGDIVEILGLSGDFYRISLGELSGYAHSAYVIEVRPGLGKARLPTCEFSHLRVAAEKRTRAVPIPRTVRHSQAAVRGPLATAPAAPDHSETQAPNPTIAAAAPSVGPHAPVLGPHSPSPVAPKLVAAVSSAESAPASHDAADRARTGSTAVPPPLHVQLSMHGVKPGVSFPHQQHMRMFACAKCHHPVGGGGANPTKDCHVCHQTTGKGGNLVANREAFHQTCRACHEATGRGPTECGTCHRGGRP